MDGRGRWLTRWILVVTCAEALGFVGPAIVGVVARETPAFVPLLLLAGALEGALLGAAQALVLRTRLPQLRRTAWTVCTIAGAIVAYGAGFAPSALWPAWAQWTWPAQAALLLTASATLLLSVGTAQWIELRRHLAHVGWWIPGTAAAWLLALSAFLAIAMPLWHEGQETGAAVLIGVIAGVAMAAVMATATGLVLAALMRTRRRST